ncbi:centrosomal protein of 89 kDa isoform X1 [Acipenser ruthenus]|uniref:centrosomal protein of 89 kDa isoform X1 n=2 Tax=Acipenser ruthenus TaxID=7906 RepID=UPI0015605E8E|nr:centrosomal protein of 89 kDa isoform X1 [Acipenser ruthenus]
MTSFPKMAFSFRRKDAVAFKHIAHGLIPAATIAPRSAVPRTPPPRSPNPSPERPRSALAAAILASTLTGRTVAIPQPRQRSLSETDVSYSENRSSIEPYASTAEIERERWNDAVNGRLRMPSPRFSDDEDDDYEDVEKEVLSEPEGHIYNTIAKEDESQIEPVYAKPCKKGRMPVSEGTDETDSSAYRVASPTLPHQLRTEQMQEKNIVQENLLQKAEISKVEETAQRPSPTPDLTDDLSLETPRTNSNLPKKRTLSKKIFIKDSKSDLTDDAYKELLEMNKEILQEMKERNHALGSENKALVQKLQEQGHRLQKTQLRLDQSQQEYRRLKEADESLSREDHQAELHSIRQQAQELVDENDAMKMTIHRLNVELSRYQTQFRPLSKEEFSKINALPMKGPPPPWLLDMKYLSPLLLAYEDRLREKDSALHAYEEEMKSFSSRVKAVVRENEELRLQLEKTGAVSNKEWRQLRDQARLVLEENQVLMEQLEVQQAKAKDSHNQHLHEVSKLTKQLMLLEAEKETQQEELVECSKQLEELRSKYKYAKVNLENKVELDEHVSTMNELKRQLQQEEQKRHAEVEDLMGRIASLQTEKKTLLLEKTNLMADNKSIETELEISRNANRKSQRKIGLLKQQLEEALDKEVAAHQYLANLISLAEKTTQERDQLIYMAKNLETDKQDVFNKIIEGTVRMGKLEEKVKVYKKKAAAKLGDMGHRLLEQEKGFAGKTDSYQREIKHLQRLLRDKQESLDEVLQQKREVEGELEIVWQSATRENKRMKDTLFDSFCQSNALNLEEASGFRARSLRSAHGKQNMGAAYPLELLEVNSAFAVSTPIRSKPKQGMQKSPMFESDSDQQQIPSSDESEKNGLEFYS